MIHHHDIPLSVFSFKTSGEPSQRIGLSYKSESGALIQGVWECEKGKFDLKFEWSETIFVLEGEAVVTNLDNGKCQNLSPGTLAVFEKGSSWNWEIHSHFKKVFTIIT